MSRHTLGSLFYQRPKGRTSNHAGREVEACKLIPEVHTSQLKVHVILLNIQLGEALGGPPVFVLCMFRCCFVAYSHTGPQKHNRRGNPPAAVTCTSLDSPDATYP